MSPSDFGLRKSSGISPKANNLGFRGRLGGFLREPENRREVAKALGEGGPVSDGGMQPTTQKENGMTASQTPANFVEQVTTIGWRTVYFSGPTQLTRTAWSDTTYEDCLGEYKIKFG